MAMFFLAILAQVDAFGQLELQLADLKYAIAVDREQPPLVMLTPEYTAQCSIGTELSRFTGLKDALIGGFPTLQLLSRTCMPKLVEPRSIGSSFRSTVTGKMVLHNCSGIRLILVLSNTYYHGGTSPRRCSTRRRVGADPGTTYTTKFPKP
jgi:hypothetical protein